MTTPSAPSGVANRLQAALNDANLHIPVTRTQLKSHRFESLEDFTPSNGNLSDPAVVASVVAQQISFLRKLKFQYLEQNAKDKYVKTIISDDAPLITAASNEEISSKNAAKKCMLKEMKEKYAEKQQDVRTLAPLVEEDYQKACSLTAHATSLSSKILDTRLALTRLRQAHPHPRLTIPAAMATLDSQVEQMQELNDELQGLEEQIEASKTNLKAEMKEIERLRGVEKERAAEVRPAGKEDGGDDPRLGGLYDWLRVWLSTQHSLLSLKSSYAVSENELRLTYDRLSRSTDAKKVAINLLFIPNSRQLASATIHCGSEDMDLGDIHDIHVQADDLPGLARAILSHIRASRAA